MVNKNGNTIAVASGGDESFAMPVAVSMYSVKENYTGNKKLTFYILDGGMSKKSVSKINTILGLKNVKWLRPDISKLRRFPKIGHLNEFTYMRLFLPEILGEKLENIIYLDGDTVTNRSIHKIISSKVNHYSVSAVRDFGGPVASSQYALKEVYGDLNIHPNTPIFNAGVIIINIEKWKKDEVFDKCVRYLERFGSRVRLADQEALNAVLVGNWGEISWKWNVQVGALKSFESWEPSEFKSKISRNKDRLLSSPYIAHFVGSRKPWKTGLNNPCGPLFVKYLRRSGWFSEYEFYRWYAKWFVRASLDAGRNMLNR